jgi:hypothetical protein
MYKRPGHLARCPVDTAQEPDLLVPGDFEMPSQLVTVCPCHFAIEKSGGRLLARGVLGRPMIWCSTVQRQSPMGCHAVDGRWVGRRGDADAVY